MDWYRTTGRSRARARLLATAFGCTGLIAGHGAALAQQASDAPREIVVTANRSSAQSLQSVASAISAVNTTQLDRAGLGNLDDLAKFTPSLSITEGAPGYNKFDMRGLTTGPYAGSDTSDRSLVAVYLDDTPISVQGQTPDLRVYDLERVEVLRGPQGTLYGASSMAGTIRFVTARPNLTTRMGSFEATAAGTEHGSDSYSLRGMLNLPLIPGQLALRGTVYQGVDGGYIDNIGLRNKPAANRNRSTQARVVLEWQPDPQFTATASATYEGSRAYGLNTTLSGLPEYTTSTNSPEGTNDNFQLYSLNLAYHLSFADLISTTSYTWRKLGYNSSIESTIGYFFQDYGTGLPTGPGAYPLFEPPSTYSQQIADAIPPEMFIINNKIVDVMQEVRLVSKDTGRFKWNVGVYYEHQRRNLYQDIPVPGFDTLSYENLFYGPFNTPDGLYNSQTVDGAFQPNDIFSGLQNLSERQIAIYTDDTLHITPQLDFTAGVRWFNFRETYYLFEGGVYGVVDHVPLTTNAVQKANGFNPRFNLAYRPDADLTLYAEAAKGFRYGGANQPVPIGSSGIAQQCAQNLANYGYSAAPLTFGPDHLWNYSVGEKARLFDGKVTINSDLYYIKWQDVQTRLALDCSYFFTDNKGQITSKGIEVETTVRVTPHLTLSASLSYTDSSAHGDLPTVGAFDGDQTPYFPHWIGSAFAFYDRPVGEGRLHMQASYQYRGVEHTTFNNYTTTLVNGVLTKNGPSQSYAVIPEQNNVSASIAYEFGPYEVGLYGNNLIDGVRITDITRATYFAVYQAGDFQTSARPRTIGIRLKARF